MEYDFRSRFGTAVVVLMLVFSTSLAMAQGIAFGSISGTVQDPQGAMVAGATVTALNTGTNQALTVQTNDVGFFTFRSIQPGTYKVTVEAKGFRSVAVSNVTVAVSRDTSLGTVKMEVAQTGETIEVVEAAPLIETSTTQVTNTFSAKAAADLPIYSGFDQLALFLPGVADTGSNNFSNTNGAAISSNGLRGRSNNFQIDGQSNNDNSVAGPSIFLGNPDLIGEVTVITNQFSVEYGRASGSVVNYVTKSGTNQFHGTAFEYWTGSFADSHTNEEKNPVFGFCRPGEDPNVTGCTPVGPISRFVENRYGGTLGGPILRDKAWFFGSYYGDRSRSAGSPSTSGSSITPTPNGLSQLAAAFPGSTAVAALNAIGPYAVTAGNPSVSGTPTTLVVSDGVTSAPIEFAGITRNVPSLFNDYEISGRGDVQITSKDRFGARYIFQKNNLTGAAGRFAAGAWVDIPAQDQQIALDWVRTFSSNFVNQARFSYSRAGFGFEGGSFGSCTQGSINNCPTGITLQGSNLPFGMQSNLPQGRLINNSQWQDNASLLMGRHTFKFGGEYYRQRSPNVFLPNINGTFTFSGAGSTTTCPTQFPGLPAYSSTICSFSRFLANNASLLALTDGPPKFNFKEQDAAAYFGDDWRIKDNLTLNLGVRWEYTSQAINLLHALSVLNQQGSNPFWDPTLPTSVTTVPHIPNQLHYFGPNVGFAWTPGWSRLGGKTVVRGGFRITYDPPYYNIFLNVATAAPVVNAGSITGCAASASGCLPSSGFFGTDVRAAHLGDIPRGQNPGTRNNTRVSSDFHEPYVEGWSFGVQQEITNKLVAEVRYVGNHVVGNFQTVNANPELDGLIANGFTSLIPSGVAPCSDPTKPGFATSRVNCDFTNLRVRENTAWSNYHGLQSELRVRDFYGVTSTVSFTWSKNMDNTSEIFSTGSGGNTVAGAQDPFNISRGERSLSGLDFPKTASIVFVYEPPFFRNQQGLIGHLLGGYQLNTTWRYTSGQLWTPVTFPGSNSSCQTNFDLNFFGLSTCRPFLGNPSADPGSVGQCTDATLSDCGLVNFFSGAPTTASAVRWIFNDDTAASFFGTPYGNVRRNPGLRGQPVNTVNLGLFKTTKLTEKLSLRLEAQVFNLLNTQFRGVPDPLIDDGNFADASGSFANTFFNSNGGDYTNPTATGIGRRRMVLGAKITF